MTMKTVNKIIITSCVVCYFIGLWSIAFKFGLIKFISRYGASTVFGELSRTFPSMPTDITDFTYKFPQMKYLYIAVIIYTVVFAIVVYIIYKTITRHAKDTEQLQSEVSAIANQANSLDAVVETYRYSDAVDKDALAKLQILQRQIASMPPAIVQNPSMRSCLTEIVNLFEDMIAEGKSGEEMSKEAVKASGTVNAMKKKCVNINN